MCSLGTVTAPGWAEGIRALLFDLGGVVIDVDFGRVLRAWARAANCDPDLLRERFTTDESYERLERGEIGAPAYFATLRTRLGLHLPDETFAAGWNDIYLGVHTPVLPLLERAALRFPLYAFTNTNALHQSVWSRRFAGELRVFRSVFASSELGLRKPDPAAFAAVAERTGFSPAEVLFFDDTAGNVTGARAAGMHAVQVFSERDVSGALATLGVGAAG